MREAELKIKDIIESSDLKIKEIMHSSDLKIKAVINENEKRQDETALNFLRMGMTPEQVATGTGLPIEKVKQLLDTNGSDS